ncbi:hypothetical protein T4D_11998 [Trichinella pseudospiralis]|uniref:Uncharacterized protein n=2 Tax=Trichinella pseudospiralis TaxID=6337 RepID=A0A0V1F4G5_TRIPS|nr:hypothetical protein T4D_11998 [Trichinella pseudospiralis]
MNRKYTWRRKKKIGASHDRRLDRIVRWSVAFIGQIEVSVDTLEKTTRFAEVEHVTKGQYCIIS